MPFSAERLIADLGYKAQPTRQGVRALADAIGSGAAEEPLRRWAALFRKTCGQDWPRPRARLDQLARHYGVVYDPSRPEVVLFALQTWYVFLVKLLAAHVLAAVRGRESPSAKVLAGNAGEAIATLMRGDAFSALAATDPWAGEPFDWCARAWSEAIEKAVIHAATRIASYDPAEIIATAASGCDLLKPLYESLFPRAVRHALGEYYTPGWLAEHVLDQVDYFGQRDARVLDPTCGSGTFLLAALRRWRTEQGRKGEGEKGRKGDMHSAFLPFSPSPLLPFSPAPFLPFLPPIVGFDLHPLAVAAARANYLLAIADIIPEGLVEVPVFARDAILDAWPEPPQFDFVVGNPPWIAWDNLPGDYREATKPLWQRYGLFSLSGNAARHGGGKKDLSMLLLYAAADRYLRSGGRLGMVITQTLFQSKGAGDGFRRFQLGAGGPPLGVLRVDDLVDVRPFGDAANWTSVIVLRKGAPTAYPVPYVKWKPCETGESLPAARKLELAAQPIDAERPTSPWMIRSEKGRKGEREQGSRGERRNEDLPFSLSPFLPFSAGHRSAADYTAHLGANSGGANAVYWLEVLGEECAGVRVRNRVAKAKRAVECVDAVIEPDLLYPLVCWKDVERWSARPSGYLLLAQDPATRAGIDIQRMRRDYPRTLAYLQQFEPMLTARAAYRRYQDRQPFYSMYNVGPYTLAAAKVVWRRMDRMLRAAVVETIDDPHLGPRPVVPQETCVLIACASGDEAHYLCALLNSSLVHGLVVSHSVAGGKGFGTPSILDYLPLRKFDPADGRHAELAALSRRLHGTIAADGKLDGALESIDRLAAEVPREGFA